ncbi:MAG: crossover junction endodeoxyribonuclease RuvC [Peptococcaceae bacterium]|nr:crossover junction endodeoxyribonuclease RuvC [Peptococcaceae bacterium]
MIILGLDPGTATTGYGVIRMNHFKISAIAYGTILTKPEMAMENRLEVIYEDLGQVLEQYRPDEVAIEKLFFGRNTTTAITVGQARGVLLLRLAQAGLPIGEYTPMQVKKALVGYGSAEKKQVQYMVQNFLNLPEIPKPDDAADALAIAICHAHSRSGLI